MIRVKICGLTRPDDARLAVMAGADAIGLVFAPSPRRVSLNQARKILADVPTFILRVGVFVNQDPEWVKRIARQAGLDRFQFHGEETAGYLRQFPSYQIIRGIRPKPDCSLPRMDPAPGASALLVDAFVPGVHGGTGLTANWDYARGLKRFSKALILSGGLKPANVGAAIRHVRPDMVDVSSGVEDRPGIKNRAKIRAFIKAVKSTGF
jgi:phosphoribosylanthranilate isomerase